MDSRRNEKKKVRSRKAIGSPGIIEWTRKLCARDLGNDAHVSLANPINYLEFSYSTRTYSYKRPLTGPNSGANEILPSRLLFMLSFFRPIVCGSEARQLNPARILPLCGATFQRKSCSILFDACPGEIGEPGQAYLSPAAGGVRRLRRARTDIGLGRYFARPPCAGDEHLTLKFRALLFPYSISSLSTTRRAF